MYGFGGRTAFSRICAGQESRPGLSNGHLIRGANGLRMVFLSIGLYPAVILDLDSPRIMGWAASQPYETRPGDQGIEDGHRLTIAASWLHLP